MISLNNQSSNGQQNGQIQTGSSDSSEIPATAWDGSHNIAIATSMVDEYVDEDVLLYKIDIEGLTHGLTIGLTSLSVHHVTLHVGRV